MLDYLLIMTGIIAGLAINLMVYINFSKHHVFYWQFLLAILFIILSPLVSSTIVLLIAWIGEYFGYNIKLGHSIEVVIAPFDIIKYIALINLLLVIWKFVSGKKSRKSRSGSDGPKD